MSSGGRFVILFLDFDGVLHPDAAYLHGKKPVLQAEGEFFMWAGPLIGVLACQPAVRIVLSTSWVRLLGFNRARSLLPAELRKRVIGATWHSQADRWEWEQMTRYQQIRRYVNRNSVPNWFALDDDAENWGDVDRGRLILCDGDIGLGDLTVVSILHEKLISACDACR